MIALIAAALVITNVIPMDREYAAQAGKLEKDGLSFDKIFAQLCQRTLDQAATNPKLRLDDCTRSMFGGLWQWVNATDHPKFQGRHDWAQHFIGGGAFEGYLDLGPRAAIAKEKKDSRDPGNQYDLDDFAATMLGSRWMDIAMKPEQTKQWLELWATGQLSLDRLPKLEFGRLPKSSQPHAEQLDRVRAFVNTALQFPPTEPPHH